jgi:hypothetical protein
MITIITDTNMYDEITPNNKSHRLTNTLKFLYLELVFALVRVCVRVCVWWIYIKVCTGL